MGGGIVVSDAMWQPLSEIAKLLPPVGSERSSAKDEGLQQPQSEGLDDRWISCPWLLDFLATGEKPSEGAEKLGEKLGEKLDIDPEAVMDALEGARGECVEHSDTACQHFKWALHGGKWTSRQDGVAYDAFDASARGQDAKQFCAEFNVNRIASFAISTLGEESGLILAIAWCHKMQWLYEKLVAEGREHVDFSPAALASYREPKELTELSRTACARTTARIEQIRGIAPRVR